MKICILAVPLLVSALYGQDVALPPKPADGPSLEVTIKFIEEKLGQIGRVNYISYVHDNITGDDRTNKVSMENTKVRASVQDCAVLFHTQETREGLLVYESDSKILLKSVKEVTVKTYEQFRKEIDSKTGRPERSTRSEPPIFVMAVQLNVGQIDFLFYEDSLAQRLAKAIVRATELCGGSGDDGLFK